MTLQEVLKEMPLIAILRHIKPSEVTAIGDVLYAAGFRCLEVPLNSPDPFDSIARLAAEFGKKALVGAGTVIQVGDVAKVAEADGKVIITPHTDPKIIHEAKRLGLCCIPGVSTPTEAYTAIHAGADALKIFPAVATPPSVVKAIKAILPPNMVLIPTGGVSPDMMADYMAAGADGFGLGGALYSPGDTPTQVAAKAKLFVDEIRVIRQG